MNAMMPKKTPARTSLLILPLMCMFVLMNSGSCSLSGGDGALGKVSQLLILSGNFVNFTDLDSE